MATFAESNFAHAAYAAFRPSYPPSLYRRVLEYHRGGRGTCVDLGCGHGLITRALSGEFTKIYGTDPSAGMIEQAESLTTAEDNVEFTQSSAESLPFLADQSVDLVVSGEAAHWFDYPRLFTELNRVMKPGGTLAFWCYASVVFVNHPKASAILQHYDVGKEPGLLGSYSVQPGHSRLRNILREFQPPREDWTDIQRLEYIPGVQGPESGEGVKAMGNRVTLGETLDYVRTWSSYHWWKESHPERKRRSEGGAGDVVDEMLDEMVAAEPDWHSSVPSPEEKVVDIEWSSALILARKL